MEKWRRPLPVFESCFLRFPVCEFILLFILPLGKPPLLLLLFATAKGFLVFEVVGTLWKELSKETKINKQCFAKAKWLVLIDNLEVIILVYTVDNGLD